MEVTLNYARRPAIYYAHPLNLYGSAQEKRDCETLEKLGFEVLNPGSLECQEAFEARDKSLPVMDFFAPLVEACDALAFRACPDGRITSGVVKEIGWALTAGKPIIELPSCISSRVLSQVQTIEYLKEVGQR